MSHLLFCWFRPKPLACYIFTRNGATEKRQLNTLSFLGGKGAYHGKAGFDTFTHKKSVLKKANWLDLPFRYQPYNAFKAFVLRLFLR